MSVVVPPYPPPRYTKNEPEVTAWVKRSDAAPDYQTPAMKYHYLANQQATGGDYGLYRVDIAPAGGGPGRTFTAPCRRRSSCCPGRCGSTTATSGPKVVKAISSTSRPAGSTVSATRPTNRPRS
jgi:hypothetical protein